MICDRCGDKTTVHTMSWFNTDDICMSCSDEEEQHPDYDYAKEKERAAVISGNHNYPGVGWPGKNGRVKR